ncbi:MAG: glycosyltransferase family 4 protein [Rhodocyclaceae bacterium]|nr:glycosyltransferase family 4 protein [Rhodocyclaceae bacterium]MCO5097917.1 glycosyltransferase family 4 protein [Rhodocyclaceae bacterium]
MKVALFVHCFFPDHFYGTETYTLELASNLIAMGHEAVVVCAAFQGETKRKSSITAYEYMHIPVYCLDRNFHPHHTVRETYHQADLFDLHRQLLSEIKPDVVHVTHLINHTASLLDAIKESGIPAIATLTDFFGICFNNRLEAADGSLCEGPSTDRMNCMACYLRANGARPRASLASRLLGRNPSCLPILAQMLSLTTRLPGMRHGRLAGLVADIVERPGILMSRYAGYRAAIAPTGFLRHAYLTNGLTAPLHVMHFGVDVPRALPKSYREGAPVKFGYIGQITTHKGTDLLVDAFVRLPPGSAELRIYGSEGQDPDYVSGIRSKAAGSPVSFLGTFPKEQLANVLADIDFLVIPSRWYENSPLVLLNSLATHTPAIVSDVEGMAEFIEDGKNGFVFCREDVDDLGRVLLKIVQNPKLISQMSKNAEFNRTTREMTEEVVGIYESAIQAVSR